MDQPVHMVEEASGEVADWGLGPEGYVEVTFPVSIRLAPAEASNPEALRELRRDLLDLVLDACLDPNRTEALTARTPDDNDDGLFGVTVGKPTVEVAEALAALWEAIA